MVSCMLHLEDYVCSTMLSSAALFTLRQRQRQRHLVYCDLFQVLTVEKDIAQGNGVGSQEQPAANTAH